MTCFPPHMIGEDGDHFSEHMKRFYPAVKHYRVDRIGDRLVSGIEIRVIVGARYGKILVPQSALDNAADLDELVARAADRVVAKELSPYYDPRTGERRMSYDLSFCNADRTPVAFDAPHDIRGGTYAVGGTPYAELNVTYNYGWFYHRLIKVGGKTGLRALDGLTPPEVLRILEPVIEDLGTNEYADYWAPTPGNAGRALANLCGLARLCPEDAKLEVH